MELQRITLNMQMSLLHSITKQAAECAEKMGQAEAVYTARLQQLNNPTQHQ
ncbi:Integrase regulator R [Pseudomonas synxantha]|nr:Integrase regulator R [Pseudomonas synxantha]